MGTHLVYRSEVFKEEDQFVAICPELNVSSFGDSIEEARRSLREALDLFLEECETMGTLAAVLQEAGFTQNPADPRTWISRTPIFVEQAAL
jgi:predicted RNase H-like HicB family nuclease